MATDETTGSPLWPGPVEWPERLVWGPDEPAFVATDAIKHLTISAEYPSDPAIHAWTGIGDLVLNGITYTGVGPEVVEIKVGKSSEKEDARMQVVLMGINSTPDLRMAFQEFRGRVIVTVRLVYSEDGGVTWLAVPRYFRGLYSQPEVRSNSVSFEVATYREELDRGYEQSWNHGNQQADYPGDRCFEHLVPIAEGQTLKSRWPP